LRLFWFTLSNWLFLGFTLAAAVAAIAVFLFSQASEREKDRALERYKADADRKIAEAHAGAERARADAAHARADAERAKLQTVEVGERLALTQERLDEANRVTPLTDEQVHGIVTGMINLKFGNTQPIASAANDLQAQRRLLQLTEAFIRADRRLYTSTSGALVAPAGEHGDILIHYWSDDRHQVADQIAQVFRGAGLETNVYKLPPEGDDETRHATQNMVLIGIAARATPSFRDQHHGDRP
jgi:hypothetical protein